MNLRGKYFSKSYTLTEETDLVTSIKTSLSLTEILIKKLDLVSDAAVTISVNGGVDSDLQTVGTAYEMHIDSGDVMINSLVVSGAAEIWVAIIY